MHCNAEGCDLQWLTYFLLIEARLNTLVKLHPFANDVGVVLDDKSLNVSKVALRETPWSGNNTTAVSG
jgi:hypothetical protein